MNHNVEQWKIYKSAVSSERGIVAAQNWMAAAAGADALARGGNAVDASVACAFALCAVEPWMSGLGGSGYAVIWLAEEKKAVAIDFQGTLPKAINPEDYPLDPSIPDTIMGFPGVADNANVVGYKSITVPGAVAGLSAALESCGRLGLDSTLAPAIQLARRGLPVDWHTTLQIALEAEELAKFSESADIYLPKKAPPKPEQYLNLRNLASTLQKLADSGPDSFYKGSIADTLSSDLKSGGSRVTIEDLAAYKPVFSYPLAHAHRGATIYTPSATSGGLRLNEALKYVTVHLDTSRPFGGHAYNTYAHALNAAFLKHDQRLGQVPDTGSTSHISVADADGNMVALTFTLLNRFGSKVVLPRTGVIMNNAVSYFNPRPGYPTSIEPGKRVNASNMCPTICVRNDKALFAVGASGANQIVPCTMQIVAFMLDFDMSIEKAFNTPRIDAGGRPSIRVDPAVGNKILTELNKEFDLEIAQNLVFPKLYSCPSGVYRNTITGNTEGCGDMANPMANAIAEAPFQIEAAQPGSFSVRA